MMADKSSVVKLGVDICKNQVNTEFASANRDEQNEVLRKALVEANNGSTKLNYKNMRRNVALFEIIEEILELTDIQGFEDNDFFERFVDYRNLALGDENSFYVPDNSLFAVNATAEGISRTLRQRINKGKSESIQTSLKTIEVYEDVNRLLSGRIDLVEFVEKIRRSFMHNRLNAIYETFLGGFSKLEAPFKVTGSYTEDKLLDLIAHVEASTGNTHIIVGTRKALSNVTSAIVSEKARERYNENGYFGIFNGTEMISIPQSHKVGNYDFAVSDVDLWVVTSDEKPVKFVTEGDAIFEQGDVLKNVDRTIDILAGERWGVGIIFDAIYGQYQIGSSDA